MSVIKQKHKLNIPQLKPYQITAALQLLEWEGRGFLADSPGLGKTLTSLAVVDSINTFPCLIETIPNGKPSWAREVSYWLKQKKTVSIIEGTGKAKLKDSLMRILLPDKTYVNIPINNWDCDVIIINYDILQYWEKEILEKNCKSVIFDESHKLKNPKSIRFKYSKLFALKGYYGKEIPVRLCLSGTPIQNRPAELISQLTLLGKLKTMGGWWYFTKRYCDSKDIKVPIRDKITGARKYHIIKDISGANQQTLAELNTKLRQRVMIRRTTKEVMNELEPTRRVIVPVQLSNQVEYIRAENEFIDWIGQAAIEHRKFQASLKGLNKEQVEEAKLIRAESATFTARKNETLIKIGYLRQLSGRGKLEAVEEWIHDIVESGEKLLVFAYHQEVQYSLLKTFPNALHMFSSDSQRERLKAEEVFQNDPKQLLMFISMMGGAENRTLTEAYLCAFPELAWTPAVHNQCEGRAKGRVNDPHSITSYYFIADNSIDEKIWNLLERKEVVCDLSVDGVLQPQDLSVLGDLKKEYYAIAQQRLGF